MCVLYIKRVVPVFLAIIKTLPRTVILIGDFRVSLFPPNSFKSQIGDDNTRYIYVCVSCGHYKKKKELFNTFCC